MIDAIAYNNKLRGTHPELKFGLTMGAVLLCLLSQRPWVGLTAVLLMSVWTIAGAAIPARTFGKLLLAEGSFLLLSLIAILISISTAEPTTLPWRTSIGPLWFASSPEQIDQVTFLFCRTLGAVSALNSLALTTPLIDLIGLWQRWRLPDLLIDLMTVMYRFIFVLLATLNQMSTAQACRLGQHGSYRQRMNNTALLGSRLFINAFQRSQRLETALRSRGYDGILRVLPLKYETSQQHRTIAAIILLILAITHFI